MEVSELRALVQHGRIPLRWIALAIGMVIGWVWLMPVYGAPDPEFHRLGGRFDPLQRIARFLCPMLIILISNRRFAKRLLLNPIFMLMLAVYFVAPCVSWLTIPSKDFFIFAILPVVVSGVVVFLAHSVAESNFRSLVIGIGATAAAMILYRIAIHGVEFNTYYLRSRAHFGFRHPLATGSALIAASGFFGLSISTQKNSRDTWVKRITEGMILALTFISLVIADSRNSVLFFLVFVVIYIGFPWFTKWRRLSQGLALAVGGVPALMIGFAVIDPSTIGERLYQRLNEYSSFRIEAMRDALVESWISQPPNFLGPSAKMAESFQLKGFASADSVFVSYINLFGIIPGLGLMLLMGYTEWILLQRTDFSARFGASVLVALCSYFCIDAQGFTASNAIMFMLFTWCLAIGSGAFPRPDVVVAPPIGDIV